MQAETKDYTKLVENHLRQYRPKEYAAQKKSGDLDRQVNSLAEGIADIVNQLQPDPKELEGLSPVAKANRLASAKMFAESDAMREMLPRDEASEALIGPTGGYEDP